ncbi:ABC1-A atypical protein kinase [Microbotryum lychnidis-dioicae p1A1 Lamole]|uniref:ABC1-A atypical protein kinase n=1 Tax=Microbotryum lychnidis-dioicae (strain p1A1 Lamole / MvSl-1064) TaxID=683840 RepID=U5HIC4_USTV1|nr:ABC1-A atypical protein kinase [Microbotryum lychnidis-dioicae p1A1 Lamole]|eukprot:KDE02669.1 ABC1-A atypical protein kinase [Microbotryum lychnidis-dioicae p1A1 Lamole]
MAQRRVLPIDESALPDRSVQVGTPTQLDPTPRYPPIRRSILSRLNPMFKSRRSSRLVLTTAWQLAASTAVVRSIRSTLLLQSRLAAAELVRSTPVPLVRDDSAAVRKPVSEARPHPSQRRHAQRPITLPLPLSEAPTTRTTASPSSDGVRDHASGFSNELAGHAPEDPHKHATRRTRAPRRQSQSEVVILNSSMDPASATTSVWPPSPSPLGDKLSQTLPSPPMEPIISSGHHAERQHARPHSALDGQNLARPAEPQSPCRLDQQATDDGANSVQRHGEFSPCSPHSDDISHPIQASPSPMTPGPSDRPGSAPRAMKASKVPASQLGRLLHYGGLAAGLGFGAASEAIKRVSFGSKESDRASSLFMSESNVRRLVDKLSRMRGAALKLGQFMSIQDARMLPEQVEDILKQVQNSANYMPFDQTEQVLASTLGTDWRTHFDDFDMVPFAAASIGQVHSARLSSRSPFAAQYPPSMRVAIKVQFPGVRASIKSDLANLKWMLMASSVLPRGLFLENTIKVMERELDDECDYVREAHCGTRMRDLLFEYGMSARFGAPRVVDELCGSMVLTTEFVKGVPLGEVVSESQRVRNEVGESLLHLCLMELLQFKFMQTDPNWSNFLYDRDSAKIQLIDFGATREYSDDFVQKFRALLLAAVHEDETECLSVSRELGYLKGEESEDMVRAHLASLLALGVPFRSSSPTPFPFDNLGPAITSTIREHIPVMLKSRSRPPPTETYSLNRKLSGVFLLCERLGSHVNARGLLDDGLAIHPKAT